MKTLTKTALLMYLFCLSYSPATAQINLVPNPSFEEYDSCQQRESIVFHAKFWNNPNKGTPDYHNTCNIFGSYCGVPQNIFGFQYPKSGNAYAGIHADNPGGNVREYIQCRLRTPLSLNCIYKVSFFVSLSENSDYACDNIGIFFSDTALLSDNAFNFQVNPQISSPISYPVNEIIEWKEISGNYKAQGNEKYIAIGVFSDNIRTSFNYTGGSLSFPYYYVDDISVVEENNNPCRMPTAFTPNGDGINDTYYPVFSDTTLQVKEFRIYNMWGEIVHIDPHSPWDGTYKGQPQPSNVYSYYLYVDLPVPDNLRQPTNYHKVGSFTLLR